MTTTSTVSMLELLGQAYQNGIKLFSDGPELEIANPPGKVVDPEVIEKLQNHKEAIYRYFLSREKDQEMERQLSARTDLYRVGDQVLYEIPKMHQHYWWVDASVEVEYKKNMYITMAWEIQGDLNMATLARTFRFLLGRHELLRTTFRVADGKYFMEIKDADETANKLEYKDFSGAGAEKESQIATFVNYTGHAIDVYKGPFFSVRIAKTAGDHFILSCKAHHSIYDLWSLDVLQRDAVAAYCAFCKNQSPGLPRLHYQYKDYTYLEYCHKRQLGDQHRQYWRTTNDALPSEMLIPGEQSGATSGGAAGYLDFSVSAETKKILEEAALAGGTSLFVVLQAALKAYIQQSTGNCDIVIGTMLFNRNHFTSLENQIGPYAKAVVIRSRLSAASFAEVVETVKKSNEDLARYTAFSLLDTFVEMLPEGCPAPGTFWKINLYYQESKGSGVQADRPADCQPGFTIAPYPLEKHEVGINIHMAIRLINTKGGLDVRVAYARNKYSTSAAESFVQGYLHFMENGFEGYGQGAPR